MKKKSKEFAEAIFKLAEEWRNHCWDLMSKEKGVAEIRKASADWNRAIAIGAKVEQVIERESDKQGKIEM